MNLGDAPQAPDDDTLSSASSAMRPSILAAHAGLTSAAQSLQASANVARAQSSTGSVAPRAAPAQVGVPEALASQRAPPGAPTAGAAAAGFRSPDAGPPAPRGPDTDFLAGEMGGQSYQKAVSVRWKRSWSIQEALDQHSSLCRQKEILQKIGANRVKVRRSQMQFAKIELEDALDRVRTVSPGDAADAAKTQALAAHIRRLSHDFAMAQRLRQVDEQELSQHIAVAEEEIEKSRLEMKVMKQAIDDKSLTIATDDAPPEIPETRTLRYCTNCKVGGHGQRFCEYLLQRPEWRVYPHQKWFEDEKHNEYHCPLGKRLVDFADESHFSRLAMYIKGRVWLEDKTKMWQLVPELMPDTYVIEDMKWQNERAPVDNPDRVLPWFVKEADRNWGTSVQVCQKASECMGLAKPGATYVVQEHIADPLLMDDGRKCHIKFYVLLMTLEDGKTWRLYTFKDGYLSVSPTKWSPTALDKDTQVTIIRTERIQGWRHWDAAYPKCKEGVAEVVRRGVAQGKLEGRLGKRQFEILSSDFIVDTRGDVWLFEFNMSPVLKDATDSPDVHDADMIVAALDLVVPGPNSTGPGNWDFAGEFVGEAPAPKAPPKEATTEDASGSAGAAASS